MSSALPPPINGTEVYLAAIHRRLGDILDRLPEPAAAEPGPTVELREPEPNVAGEQTAAAGARGGAKSKPAGGKGRGRPQAATRSTSKPREG